MQHDLVSFAEVKRLITIEAVLARYGFLESLTPKGVNIAGPCPFCKGKSARQFQVSLVKNAWYCFGCKAGGNILDFVAKREGVSVRSAAEKLAHWFGLAPQEKAPPARPQANPAKPVDSEAEAPPRENPPLAFTLKTLDPGHASLAALGFQTATLERFGAGYCSKGLLKGRLAIPIHNCGGELVAYAGLALESDQAPRYLFPPNFQVPLEVMNLHQLASFAAKDGPLYLAPDIEGVLRLTEAGLEPVLGLFDGSLSESQEEAMRGALSLAEHLTLVGEGFPDRTVARLARHTVITWVPARPGDPLAGDTEGAPIAPEEGIWDAGLL